MITGTEELLFTPDPEQIIRENRRERKLAQQQKESSSSSTLATSNVQMAEEPIMGDYCRRTDGDQVTL
ncbi:hypothetical protein A2U01_0087587, partial [Trifolium medium]|nr:hypothetical protein [Trifolium medium]